MKIPRIFSFILLCSLTINSVNAKLVFVTEENAVNTDNFIINADDSSSDFVDLEFGSALGVKMRYDILNNKFILNRDLQITQIIDSNGNTGLNGQTLISDGSGKNLWTAASANTIPYISTTVIKGMPISSTATFNFEGFNFTPTTTINIPGFDGTINSTTILSPTNFEINITSGTTPASYDIIASNAGLLNTSWSGNGTGLLIVSNKDGTSQVSAGKNCKTLLDNGLSTGNGIYWIDPDGGSTANAYEVYCDMINDGGGWTLVFRHDSSGGFFANNAESDSFNEALPGLTTKKYSILNKINSIKNAAPYEFRLYYPDQNIRNHWTQTFDPRSGTSGTSPVAGYTAIAIDASGSLWGGLDRDISGNTFLDGSVAHTNWWYSIGSNASYNGGMPGPSVVVNKVELFIR